jgi:hypothetical protein
MSCTYWKSSILVMLAACASSTPGARPHDMSAAQHERSADEHARTAEGHTGDYDPNAKVTSTGCGEQTRICWTSVENPTAEHLRAADEHRRHAADHRAAAVALRDAEARACAGLHPDDRDISPFDRIEDIAKVDPLQEQIIVARSRPVQRTAGAVVTFRARPGMTAEWLQRIVDCHLARSAALGHVVPEMPNCPLVPKGVAARVTSTGTGFAITIRSDDPAAAQEVLDRARRSLPRSGEASSRAAL